MLIRSGGAKNVLISCYQPVGLDLSAGEAKNRERWGKEIKMTDNIMSCCFIEKWLGKLQLYGQNINAKLY